MTATAFRQNRWQTGLMSEPGWRSGWPKCKWPASAKSVGDGGARPGWRKTGPGSAARRTAAACSCGSPRRALAAQAGQATLPFIAAHFFHGPGRGQQHADETEADIEQQAQALVLQ